MIDLETMGTYPGVAILSIGACAFRAGEGVGEKFKINASLASNVDAGLQVDPSTEMWWEEQSEEARQGLLDPEPVDIRDALQSFSNWYVEQQFERIWSHGAAADVAWLEAAYRQVGMDPPWKYRDSRDTRTAFDFADVDERTTPEVEHDALHDAVAQATDVCSAIERVSMALGHDI